MVRLNLEKVHVQRTMIDKSMNDFLRCDDWPVQIVILNSTIWGINMDMIDDFLFSLGDISEKFL